MFAGKTAFRQKKRTETEAISVRLILFHDMRSVIKLLSEKYKPDKQRSFRESNYPNNGKQPVMPCFVPEKIKGSKHSDSAADRGQKNKRFFRYAARLLLREVLVRPRNDERRDIDNGNIHKHKLQQYFRHKINRDANAPFILVFFVSNKSLPRRTFQQKRSLSEQLLSFTVIGHIFIYQRIKFFSVVLIFYMRKLVHYDGFGRRLRIKHEPV